MRRKRRSDVTRSSRNSRLLYTATVRAIMRKRERRRGRKDFAWGWRRRQLAYIRTPQLLGVLEGIQSLLLDTLRRFFQHCCSGLYVHNACMKVKCG
jgi:hypothetical protein